MQTDSLMLNRSLGSAFPDQYVDWAVERLCDGSDTPSLRILAGLNPRCETAEIEEYFLKTCRELEIDCVKPAEEPRRSLGLVRRSYERGDISSETAFHMLARLYAHSDYSDPLLAVFYEIEEEISMRGSGHEGCFYPPEALEKLDDALLRELRLFTEATQLDLPKGFIRFIRCQQCRHIGQSRLRHKTLKDKLRAAIPGLRPRPALWHTCARCGSFDYKIMMDPEVRQDFYNRIKSEQGRGANALTRAAHD
jgi:hypothetical protein